MSSERLAPDGVARDPSTRPSALVGMTVEAIPEKPVGVVMADDVKLFGQYLKQMGNMMAAMQKRMDEMEARQRQVTVTHEEVKRIQRLIRMRAQEICDKYALEDDESPKAFRKAIRKDVMSRWGVRDLHDLPEAAAGAVRSAIGSWVNIRMVMERRTQG